MEGNKCPRCGSHDIKAVNKPLLGEPTEWVCGVCFNHWNYDRRDYKPQAENHD